MAKYETRTAIELGIGQKVRVPWAPQLEGGFQGNAVGTVTSLAAIDANHIEVTLNCDDVNSEYHQRPFTINHDHPIQTNPDEFSRSIAQKNVPPGLSSGQGLRQPDAGKD